VLTTPSLILLMEDTAQAVTAPLLPREHTTVGFEIAVRHLAPTVLGEEVRVTAELLAAEGRKLLFAVSAYNARTKIGEGTIRRTIVRIGSLEPGPT
jgi:predicted thioesterase